MSSFMDGVGFVFQMIVDLIVIGLAVLTAIAVWGKAREDEGAACCLVIVIGAVIGFALAAGIGWLFWWLAGLVF